MSFLCYMQSRALRTTSGMSGMRNAEAAHSGTSCCSTLSHSTLSWSLETVREVYTVEEAIECIGFGRFQLKMFVFAGLLWVCVTKTFYNEDLVVFLDGGIDGDNACVRSRRRCSVRLRSRFVGRKRSYTRTNPENYKQ